MSTRKNQKNKPKAPPKKAAHKALLPKTMMDVQKTHLDFLEEWGSILPKVAGIPVMQTMTYFLVQILNKNYIDIAEKGGE